MPTFKFLLVASLLLLLAIQFNASWQTHRKYGARVHDASFDAPRDGPSSLRPPRPSKLYPRTISIDRNLFNRISSVPYTKKFEQDSVPSEPPIITKDWFEPNAAYYNDNSDNCEPMYDWQLESFPNCNKFHELDLSTMRFINSGGSRSAFELKEETNGSVNKFVYKSVKFYRDITEKAVEEQRKDGLLLERMSSSPFIPDVHGYCSVAVMMDFMPEGSMHDYIKGVRIAGGNTLSPVDRLRIAIHIAGSVAALHTIDGTEQPSFFHNDLCCHQYLFQDGIFKLNDFNYARPIYVDRKTRDQCKRRHFHMGMWTARSLEEHQGSLGYPDFKPVKPDKHDVWMMGNLMYIIMTDMYLFEIERRRVGVKNLKWQDAGKKLIAGERTEFPEHIRNSTDPSYVAMQKALDMCWTYNWTERPSARSVSDYLMGELQKITGEENPDLRVTLPQRDPGQKPTDNDYDHWND